jgi:hypothetical protein
MKKVILATMALTFTAISNANATENTRNAVEDTLKVKTNAVDTLAVTPVEDTVRQAATAEQVERKAVQIADLPSGVKTALAGEQFTGWKADRAFWVTGNTADELSNGKGAAGNTNIRSAKNATESMESPTGTAGTNGTVTNGATTASGRTKTTEPATPVSGTTNTATGNTTSAAGTGTVVNHNGYYEVELSKNTDTKTVRFDKEGGQLK